MALDISATSPFELILFWFPNQNVLYQIKCIREKQYCLY